MIPHINILLLGNIDSGKSTICTRLADKENETESTLGIEETKIRFTYQQNNYHIKLIDTSGDPHYLDLIEPQLAYADAVLFVFSFNNQQSFDDLDYWIELAEPFVDHYTTLMILGNKSEDKQFEKDVPQKLAKEKGMLFSEISALYKIGIQDMLETIVSSVIQKRRLRAQIKSLKIDPQTIEELKLDGKTRYIRVGVVGDPSLGNFRVFNRVSDKFNAKDTIQPLYHNYLSKKAELYFPNDHIIVQFLDIIDTELKKLLTNPHFQVPQVLLVTFNMESRKSFDNMEAYYDMFQGNSRFIIIGTKSDSLKRQITLQQLQQYATNKISKYFQLANTNTQFVQTLLEYIICTQPRNSKQKRRQSDATSQHSDKKIIQQRQKPRSQKQPPSSSLGLVIGIGAIISIGAILYYKMFRK